MRSYFERSAEHISAFLVSICSSRRADARNIVKFPNLSLPDVPDAKKAKSIPLLPKVSRWNKRNLCPLSLSELLNVFSRFLSLLTAPGVQILAKLSDFHIFRPVLS